MSDSVDKLSKATGLHRANVMELWASVKANSAKLDSCPRHDFVKIDNLIGGKYRCSRCDGETDSIAVRWYLDGLKHAGGGND